MEQLKYEEYARNEIGIPLVNFSNIPILNVEQIVEAIDDVVKRFPLLKNMICSIGDMETINANMNLLVNSNPNNCLLWKNYFEDEIKLFETIVIEHPTIPKLYRYSGIVIGSEVCITPLYIINHKIKEATKKGYMPKCFKELKSYVYHEMAHMIEMLLDLSNDEVVNLIIKTEVANNDEALDYFGSYAKKDKVELICQMLATYFTSPLSSEAAYRLGIYVEKIYHLKEHYFTIYLRSQVNNKMKKYVKKTNKQMKKVIDK